MGVLYVCGLAVLFAMGDSPIGHRLGVPLGLVKVDVPSTAFNMRVSHLSAELVGVSPGFTVNFVNRLVEKWFSRHTIVIADSTLGGSTAAAIGVATVYENQRRITVLGIGGDFGTKALGIVPGDPKPWSDVSGETSYSGLDDHRVLPRGAAWVSGGQAWAAQGWKYGLHWGDPLGGWSAPRPY